MSDRTPATDKGTADRIEADDGGYWVRLVTKQALRREGVCMGNCLDSRGYGQGLTGDERMVSDGFWSLRKADGLSYLLIEIDTHSAGTQAEVENAAGPQNSQPSAWSIRQLRQLVVAFRDAGATLSIPEKIALTGADGRTWRPDKAPQDLQDAVEPRRKAETARRANPYAGIVYGRIMVRPAGSDAPFTEVELVGGGSSGFLTPGPASDVRDEAPAGPDGAVLYRTGPNEPFRILRGRERHEAISAAMRQGIITGYEASMDFRGRDEPAVETITVRLGGDPARHTTQNEDGTYKLNLGDLVFPKVMPSGEIGFGTGDVDTVTFRIAPAATRAVRRARFVSGRDAAYRPGPIITDLSAEIRMTPISYRALVDGMALLGGDGPCPDGGGGPQPEA
ncbi:hypothetical protein [uncultured Methylobacterium sp.]|uniref:hypothetical protein n=1 Tax=uncultured Methylobacterium sp. TaxID=157278 RepID=UPI0035CABA89